MPAVWKNNGVWKIGGNRRESEGDTNREKHRREMENRSRVLQKAKIESHMTQPFCLLQFESRNLNKYFF